MKRAFVMTAIFATATAAAAQQFTTAAEVKPILSATRDNWVALRDYGGHDLIYFTQLEAWRCGLKGISYSVNGQPAVVYKAEPCHEGSAQPNAMTLKGHLPYLEFPEGSVKTLTVKLTYDDGSTDQAHFARKDVLMP